MNAGFGIWIVGAGVWCRSTDGAEEAAMVLRTLPDAEREAKRQSEMYVLGPCEARPFDWDREGQP